MAERIPISEPRTVEICNDHDDTLYVEDDPVGGIRIWRGNGVIADESPAERARLANVEIRFAQRRYPLDARICFIGAGTCYLPRMLNLRYREEHPVGNEMSIFELHPEIISWNENEHGIHSGAWTFVPGDWLTTYPGTGPWDVVFYDLPDPAPPGVLEAELSAEGLVFNMRD